MNIPSIPDNIFKLLIVAGVLCLGYSYFENKNAVIEYNDRVEAYHDSVDSLDLPMMQLEHRIDKIEKLAAKISNLNGIPNPLKRSPGDSVALQNLKAGQLKIAFKINDTLETLLEDLSEINFRYSLLRTQVKNKSTRLDEARDLLDEQRKSSIAALICGFMILVIGINGMFRLQNYQDELNRRVLNEKPKYYEHCQSCGKVFSSVRKHGKEVDGLPNNAFCADCYDDGSFKEPLLTKQEFLTRVETHIKSQSQSHRKALKRRVKNLERWNDNPYF